MACLFSHKWNGCTCGKCGKTRDEGHQFEPVADTGRTKCTVCGKEKRIVPMQTILDNPRGKKALDDALAYCVDVGKVLGIQQMTDLCKGLVAKLRHPEQADFTDTDADLADAVLTRYSEDIPSLVEANPAYAARAQEMGEEREYIVKLLVDFALVRMKQKAADKG